MPFHLYRPYLPLVLHDRTWPDRQLTEAPRWASVDLRDGNQALIDPMDPERKLALFEQTGQGGVQGDRNRLPLGLPTRLRLPAPDHRGRGLIPDDVTIQVLVQCREELIERTFESLTGARQAIVHFYNSTSELQRRVVFGLDRAGIVDIAVNAARLARSSSPRLPDTAIRYEYSPESFTGTEPDFAVEICEAVMDVIEPTPARPLILNLPATVEMFTPNVYADVHRAGSAAASSIATPVIVSLHPHNDRGTAVAAAELAVLAGADRVVPAHQRNRRTAKQMSKCQQFGEARDEIGGYDSGRASVAAVIWLSKSRCQDSEEGIFSSRSNAMSLRIFSISV